MQSFSTTLLQKVLWAKLQTWIVYIDKESKNYTLSKQENKIIINGYLASGWTFPIILILFRDSLIISMSTNVVFGGTNGKETKIDYSDPQLYKKMFDLLNHMIAKKMPPQVETLFTNNSARSGVNLKNIDWKDIKFE